VREGDWRKVLLFTSLLASFGKINSWSEVLMEFLDFCRLRLENDILTLDEA